MQDTTDNKPHWTNAADLAERLGCSVASIRRMRVAGLIPAIRIGLTGYRYQVEEVEAALAVRR